MNPRVKAAEAIAEAIDRCALAITSNVPEDDYRHVKVIRELVESLLVLEAVGDSDSVFDVTDEEKGDRRPT
jgi:succinyl-CoA synthetase alpha subunit